MASNFDKEIFSRKYFIVRQKWTQVSQHKQARKLRKYLNIYQG